MKKHTWNIEFKDVNLIYPNGKEALKNINLKIEKGEIVAIIGLSGAGKTTLLKTINKLSKISDGEIFVGDTSKEIISQRKANKFAWEVINKYKKDKNSIQFSKLLKEIEFIVKYKIDYNDSLIQKRNKKIIYFQSQIKEIKSEKIESSNERINFYNEVKNKAILEINKKNFILENKIKINKNKNKKYYELNSQIQKSNNDSTHVVDLSYDFETIFDDIYKEQQKTIKFQKQNLAYFALKNIKGKQLRKYRTNVGMIFQRYNLIYKSSVLTNVISGRLSQMNPFRAFFGIYSKKDVNIALKALADVNILETAYVRADELSGGQQQRVALARTIAQNGSIILADEPVGALDPIMAKEVMDSFLKVNKESKKTVLLNLHHVDLALTYADRIIGVKKGKIVFDGSSWKVDMNVLKKIYGEELEGFDNHELKEIKRKREKLYKEFPQYKDLSKNKKLFTKGSKNNV